MIQISCKHKGHVGDSLAKVPYIAWLSRQYDTYAVITGAFNPHVAELLGRYMFLFEDHDTSELCDATYTLDVTEMDRRFRDRGHMSQSYFLDAREFPPDLPITLKLQTAPCPLPAGLVISPYSWSDSGSYEKTWPHTRWIELIGRLREHHLADVVYIVGAIARDDPEPYVKAGIVPVFDFPLTVVLNLLRHATAVLSVDNGISHLAHYGGVAKHVLLYPGYLPDCWVANPRGRMIHRGHLEQIQVSDVFEQARQVLEPVFAA
jgi:ADP-heptose:LPS heptosyltransferase